MTAKSEILSDNEIITMLQENNPLAWEHLYDKYSPAMYGLIFNLTKDKLLAQEIFMNSFLELKQTLEKIKCVLLPVILRHTYFYTTKYLERISLTPKTINPPKEAEIINLCLTQCNSLSKAASMLNITVGETKKRLRVEFLNLRIQKNISENALRVVN